MLLAVAVFVGTWPIANLPLPAELSGKPWVRRTRPVFHSRYISLPTRDGYDVVSDDAPYGPQDERFWYETLCLVAGFLYMAAVSLAIAALL